MSTSYFLFEYVASTLSPKQLKLPYKICSIIFPKSNIFLTIILYRKMKVIVMYLKKRPGKVQKGNNPKKGIIGSNNIRTTITEAIDILLSFQSEIQNKQNR